MTIPVPQNGRLGFVGDYTGAVLTRFDRVRNWRWNGRSNPDVRRYSGTRFGTQRVPAFTEYDGSFQGYGALPPLFVGDEFTFIGYTAPTDGTPCTPGCAFSVLALVERLSITWNWTAENKLVFWEIGFNSNEDAVVLPTFDDPCDDDPICFDNPCNLEFRLKNPCAADALIDFGNLVSATLNFTSENTTYSNNSTGCLLKRKPGALDFTLDVVDQNPCIVPIINADYRIEIEASPTTHWLLKWAQYLGFSDHVIDTETNTMIGKTNHFAMQAVSCCVPGTPVRGEIIDPATNILWPYATPV